MSLRIQTNVEAFNAQRQLTANSNRLSKAMEKLSSGNRISRGAEDAAGLAISERMRGQIGGLGQASRNAGDAISLVQTAEGALNEVHSMLQRVRELAVQYKNGTLNTTDRNAIQSEVNQLASEIERIGTETDFNGTRLLNTATTITFQVGSGDAQQITVATISVGAQVASAVFALSAGGACDIDEIDTAINNVSAARATFGAVQNRLEHTTANLSSYHEKLSASESRIRDVDMASEMVSFTKSQILQVASMSMLSQANQAPQGVLALLR
ncbi:MAG: flagellin [Thermoleophilaceae bacterium]|nr:flagellin [Thermoleophilaceae bacterium]